MKKRRVICIALITFAGFVLVCGLPGYGLFHLSLHEKPERIYPHYSRELEEYGRRLVAGDVVFVEGRGYAIPQYLIDKGAKWVYKSDTCYGVVFSSMLDNPTPMLWYSPNGFDPMPPELSKLAVEPQAEWRQVSPKWGMCYKPWWLNV